MASCQAMEVLSECTVEHPHQPTEPPEPPTGRASPDFNRPNMSETRIVLVGKTGAGKSSCANTIFGRNAFRSAVSISSVTRECSKVTQDVGDRLVTIVDTPGLFDTSIPEDKVNKEIAKCVNMSAPGPHAIVVVIKVCPFTTEEMLTIEKIEQIFGKHAAKHTMVLFTYGDEIESIDRCLEEADVRLRQVLQRLGNRYHVFNNIKKNDRTQVLELFDKIDEMASGNVLGSNNDGYYSNPTYIEVVKILDEREKKLKDLFEKKMRENEATLIARHKGEIEALKKENQNLGEALEKLKNKHDRDLKETQRYFWVLGSDARRVIEEIPWSEDFENPITAYVETLCLS